jgi:hypothetical protein
MRRAAFKTDVWYNKDISKGNVMTLTKRLTILYLGLLYTTHPGDGSPVGATTDELYGLLNHSAHLKTGRQRVQDLVAEMRLHGHLEVKDGRVRLTTPGGKNLWNTVNTHEDAEHLNKVISEYIASCTVSEKKEMTEGTTQNDSTNTGNIK